jgi:Fe2+ or Zn2+ uptake regulation protein
MKQAYIESLFLNHLKKLNLKLTWERKTILEAVFHWKGHFSPYELFQYFKTKTAHQFPGLPFTVP